MFLMKLEENEKIAFMELARYIMEVNISDGEKEKEILKAYAYEMNVDLHERFEFSNIEDLLKTFKSRKYKKIVLLEIMALIYADENIDEEEEKIIQLMCNELDIPRHEAKIYEEWTKAILSLYKQGELFLMD